ncbi:MAG: lactate dehydrogenase [Oscillospiraceae bacterium]|nr:lactate dehydrogenase [Oscillospiraceae bacterium]
MTAPLLKKTGLRLTLVGLGDVGGTLLTALKLLGDEIDEIGVYDPYGPLIDRYCMELGQVLERPTPRIVRREEEALFDCDVFLFAASRGVPPVGTGGDVRMLQFEGNRALLKRYAKQARASGFSGLFCQISDPVDLLCRCVYWQSNTDESGNFDGRGLSEHQIVGFGLGVMAARAQYYARLQGLDPAKVAAFGPHGKGLVIANDLDDYDDALSLALTKTTVEANRAVRALGFKPYIAPALSSACISLLHLLRGTPFYGAIPTDGVYFGCLARWTERGAVPLHDTSALPAPLQRRIARAMMELKEMESLCRL